MPFSSVRRATRQALAGPAGPALSGLALGAILALGPAFVPAAQAAVCRVPGTYATIQAAVADDTCTRISVAAGDYEGTLAIARSVTLLGAGPARTSLDGKNGGSVVKIAPNATVTITGITIKGGDANHNDGDPNGGGIVNAGTLTIDNSTVTQNSAYNGGGIWNVGTLTVTNSTLAENTAFFIGGIFNDGTLTIDNSTLTGNTATTDGLSLGVAGGIFNAPSRTVTITNSTLTENTAPFGGGIENKGTLTIINSTLTGNVSTHGGGGGIWNVLGTLTIHNSTLTGNTAPFGGGIFNDGGHASITRVTFQDNSSPECFGVGCP